jgi:hypothetical protein
MRIGLWSLMGLIGALALAAQNGADKTMTKRYGIEADLKSYPQATPKETLASLLKTIDAKRVNYVLAQMTDPDWVDRRVKETEGGFIALVEEGTARLVGDPAIVKRFKKLNADGEWKIDTSTAVVRMKDMDELALFFRKVGERWYIENRKQ